MPHLSLRATLVLTALVSIVSAGRAFAQPTEAEVGALALANVGKGAGYCSRVNSSNNSLGGNQFETSCSGNGGPEYWCADFAMWVWAHAGGGGIPVGGLDAAAGSFYVYGQNHGTLHTSSSYVPRVGDAIVFNYAGGGRADHVGLVGAVNSDGSIQTVNGDFSGQSGSMAWFAETSHVEEVRVVASQRGVGSTPSSIGMTISAYVTPAGLRPPNTPPHGYLDGADCTLIHGWAQDADVPTTSIDVHVYIGGPAGAAGAVGFPLHADEHRADLCTAIGSCNHGFSMHAPLSFFDGHDHPVYAYAIDSAGGTNTLLTGAPHTLHCGTAPVPTLPHGVVRRHVPSPAVLSAWGFHTIDIAPLPDAMLNAIPDGPDVTAAPDLVQVSGQPAIYQREYGTLRHVPDPAAMTAWGFASSSVHTVTASALAADLMGADMLGTPFLAQGSGAAVYLIDAPPPLWATLVSDDAPAMMLVGSTADVTLTFENHGSMTWTAGAVTLAPTPRDVASTVCDPSWPSCTRAAHVAADAAPGAQGTFHVRLRAPSTPGPVTTCFGLVTGTHWFSDAGENGPADHTVCRTIQVVSAQSDGGGVFSGADGGIAMGGSSPHNLHGSCSVSPGHTSSLAPWLLLAAAIVAWRRRRA
jgi:MYXO-CTERM domain-containing protein